MAKLRLESLLSDLGVGKTAGGAGSGEASPAPIPVPIPLPKGVDGDARESEQAGAGEGKAEGAGLVGFIALDSGWAPDAEPNPAPVPVPVVGLKATGVEADAGAEGALERAYGAAAAVEASLNAEALTDAAALTGAAESEASASDVAGRNVGFVATGAGEEASAGEEADAREDGDAGSGVAAVEAVSVAPASDIAERAVGLVARNAREEAGGGSGVAPGAETGGGGSLYQPESEQGEGAGDLRALLVSGGVANAKQMAAAETIMKQSAGKRLIDLLLEQGVDEVGLFGAVARSMGLSFRRLEASGPEAAFDDKLVHRMTPEFCKQNSALPLGVEQGRLVLATSRPDDVFLVDEVKRRTGARSVLVVVCTPLDLKGAMSPLEAEAGQEVNVDEILGDIEEDDVRVEASSSDEVDLEREAGESPVIRYVNYIIHTAAKEGASDIHIEPGDKSLKVRFRIDGELFEMMQPPAKMAAAITSRLKIMGNLDISERRLPQDGRIRCTVQNRKLDLRMSTLPSTYGEKVVLRILDTRSINVSLDDLGFSEETLTNWKHQIDQPHGIVLVTGPTGSGKTTTLYASLRQMDKKSMNISTVEDPVEYHLEGITQTQTHEKIGMTFARALKALLRQDPDVILVGEIRDQETAHTAVQAALTGHLVLSTLHTNDAPSSITRLVNIGLEPFLLGAAVNAALAQRLVRRVCQHCKRAAQFTDEMKEFVEAQGLDPATLVEGEGCGRCRNTGHQGRLGIYELLVIDDHLRDIIARNPNVSEFRRTCLERGMVSLRQDGFVKAARGQTTVQEIIRATESAT